MLVRQVGSKITSDVYGRRDTADASKELSYFHERVAAPELADKGYPREMIIARFGIEKENLLRPILKEALVNLQA